jgi:hypothetical protein
VNLNEVGFYTLPTIVDEEDHKVIISCAQKPEFVIIEESTFTFMPNDVG